MSNQNVSELARKAGIKPSIVHNRIHRGWSLEEALEKRPRLKKKSTKKAAPKKKFKKVVEDAMPQVKIPEPMKKPPADVDKYEDGFIIAIAIAALAGTVALLLWMVGNQ